MTLMLTRVKAAAAAMSDGTSLQEARRAQIRALFAKDKKDKKAAYSGTDDEDGKEKKKPPEKPKDPMKCDNFAFFEDDAWVVQGQAAVEPTKVSIMEQMIDEKAKETADPLWGRSNCRNKFCWRCDKEVYRSKLTGVESVYVETVDSIMRDITSKTLFMCCVLVFEYYNREILLHGNKIWTLEMIREHYTVHKINMELTLVENARMLHYYGEQYKRTAKNLSGHPDNKAIAGHMKVMANQQKLFLFQHQMRERGAFS